jgi:hypothetical protein
MRYSNLILIVILCFSAFATVPAQDGSTQSRPNAEVEELKKRIEEQERQLRLMREQIDRQIALADRQQKAIDELLKSREQQPKADVQTIAVMESKKNPSSRSPEVKPVPQPTPKPANNVEIGFGKVRFTGLLQGWYSAGNGIRNSFRIRRAQMKFTGQILPKVRWTLMIDPAKALSVNSTTSTIAGVPVVTGVSPNQASRIMQDAFITLTYIKDVNIDFGQYKIPLTLEGLQSSSTLDTVDRALFMSDRGRGGGLGDVRDFGIQFSGPLGKRVNYQIGVFNGTGEVQNSSDNNQEKAVIGRFVVRPPFIKGLQVGVSGALSNADRVTNPRRDRLGGELLYTNKKVKIKTEVMGGVDGDLHRLGFYSHFGYRISPKLEAIFRIDGFDPDRRRETSSTNVFELDYVTGFNYFIKDNNIKFQLNYVRKTFNNGIQSPRNLFLTNLQTAW